MAEIKEITVSRSCKMNLGNYESVDHFIVLKADVSEFDTPEEVIEELQVSVDSAMALQLQRSHKARGKEQTLAQVIKHHGLASARKPKA